MAERVVLHIGVPKSGTSYLQHWLWKYRDRLRGDGVLVPGSRADHALATNVVREDPALANRSAAYSQTWPRLLAELADWPGTGVVSHEFFGAATVEQAAGAVRALSPARVELVVTARDALSVLTSAWQESLKYGDQTPLEHFSTEVSSDPLDVWNWRCTDVGEVLARWAPHVPADQVHVIVPPKGGASDVLWERFADLLGVDPAAYAVDAVGRNPSMGLVQAEVLRRVTPRLDALDTGLAQRIWMRDYLGGRTLARLDGERFHPSEARVDEARERSRRAVQGIREAGYDVRGDLDHLLVPDDLPARRTPEDVTDAEVADEAARVVAAVLLDLRTERLRLRKVRRRLKREAGDEPAAPPPSALGRAARRLASITQRSK